MFSVFTTLADGAAFWTLFGTSVTPVLLDRFPDHGNVAVEGKLTGAACRNIGLPEPVEIELHKHSAIKGAPSAYPARGNRDHWTITPKVVAAAAGEIEGYEPPINGRRISQRAKMSSPMPGVIVVAVSSSRSVIALVPVRVKPVPSTIVSPL